MAGCSCGNGSVRLLYACAGAANTGLLADRAVRLLARSGAGKMTCLASMGAGISGFIESAGGADANVVIDGCPIACGAKIFRGLKIPYRHFTTTDFDVEKGKTEITDELVEQVTFKIAEAFIDEPVAEPVAAV